MVANKSRGTKIELLLAKLLWNAGIRYRKNDKGVHGTPDFTIRGHRIAIFCDGDFWHGKDWTINKDKIKSNRSFWYAKIEHNIKHDQEITKQLESEGWKVFRFWETDIRIHAEQCLNEVLSYIQLRLSHDYHNRTVRYTKYDEPEHLVCASEGETQYVSSAQSEFTFIDLFAGIGGFRIAMENIGGRCIFSSDWNTEAQSTYFSNFGEIPFGDLTNEDVQAHIPEVFDILCASLPSQRFLLKKKKVELSNLRGTLFYQLANIIKTRTPKAFIIETDKFMLTSNHGKDITILLEVMRNVIAYNVLEPITLKANDYGLPHNTERIYLVGFRKDIDPSNFKRPEALLNKTTFESIQEAAAVSSRYYLSNKVMSTLRKQKEQCIAAGKKWKYEAASHGSILHVLQGQNIRSDRNFVIDHRIYTTTRQLSESHSSISNNRSINQEGIRRLTPREVASLQGFPTNFDLQLEDTASYKLLERATVVNLAQAIGKEVIKMI